VTAIVMDGKAVAAKVRAEVAVRAREFAGKYGRRPGLAVVQVGQDPASTVYVRNKRKSSVEAEIESFAHDLPATTSQSELLDLVHSLNRDPRVDGILVDLESEVSRADVVVVAVGKAGFVPGDWIKPGAAVFDVGINRGADGKLVGDVAYDKASQRAGWITPVPGGLGPMTIAMLLSNAVDAAVRRSPNL